MSYCTLEQARSGGARGTDAEIVEAIAAAEDRVNRYTGDLFEPTPQTLTLDVDGDGLVRPRRRIQSVTSVTWLGASTPMVTSAYVVSSSLTGGRDTIALYGDLSWADVTVLGAEPWNGGFANLSRRRDPQVVVVGVFGWTTPPFDVTLATALIAAEIRSSDLLTDSGSAGGTTADTEGNVLPVVPPFVTDDTEQDVLLAARVRSRTTGVLRADALLSRYVREPVRMRA